MIEKEPEKEEDIKPLVAPCRIISVKTPFKWLSQGWQDIKQAPKQSICYGVIMVGIGYLITAATWYFGNLGLYLGLISGFVFIGPVLAFTLYDISFRLEKGMPVSLKASMLDAKTQIGNALIFTILLGIIFLVWARAATMVHIFFPQNSDARWTELVTFLTIGSAVGAIFCAVIFTASAFSLPMIMDRDTDTITAVITSVNAVLKNKPAMAVWAMIIVGCVIIGLLTAHLAFAVLLPLLGHATYHAYKDVIDPSDWPERRFVESGGFNEESTKRA